MKYKATVAQVVTTYIEIVVDADSIDDAKWNVYDNYENGLLNDDFAFSDEEKCELEIIKLEEQKGE